MPKRPAIFPISLLLEGERCLIVGGGQAALARAESLISAGAVVTVVAEHAHEGLTALDLELHVRPYQQGEASGYRLVFAASDDEETDVAVAADARRLGVLVNAVDRPAACTFFLPAVLRRGELSVAVATAGASPAISSYVRDTVADLIGTEFATLVEIVAETRDRVRSSGRSSEGLEWQALVGELTGLLAGGSDDHAAREAAARWLESALRTGTERTGNRLSGE